MKTLIVMCQGLVSKESIFAESSVDHRKKVEMGAIGKMFLVLFLKEVFAERKKCGFLRSLVKSRANFEHYSGKIRWKILLLEMFIRWRGFRPPEPAIALNKFFKKSPPNSKICRLKLDLPLQYVQFQVLAKSCDDCPE